MDWTDSSNTMRAGDSQPDAGAPLSPPAEPAPADAMEPGKRRALQMRYHALLEMVAVLEKWRDTSVTRMLAAQSDGRDSPVAPWAAEEYMNAMKGEAGRIALALGLEQ